MTDDARNAQREYNRKYYQEHHDRIIEQKRKWRAEHADHIKTYRETYWAKKAAEKQTANRHPQGFRTAETDEIGTERTIPQGYRTAEGYDK